MNNVTYISVIIPLKLEWEPCYSVMQDSNHLQEINIGDRVKVMFAGKEYIGTVSDTEVTPETDVTRIRPIISIESHLDTIFPEEIALWRQVAEYYMCTVGEVYKAAYPTHKTSLEEAKGKATQRADARRAESIAALKARINGLQERISKKNEQLSKARKDTTRESYSEQIRKAESEIYRLQQKLEELDNDNSSGNTEAGTYASLPILNRHQEEANRQIDAAFVNGKNALLHGVTGSGKTEIYIRKAMETMAHGKNVLYLVPEIALSRQLEERLYRYFGQRLMIFHSAQTAAVKRDIACQMRKSGGYIVLGTRSSVFLPHNNLGLIIVDEEHDNSYKQDSPAPRYNGRDTALMLSRIHKADLIMGSATPSLESLYNCQAGKHAYIQLESRYHGGEDSDVEIIDTKEERRKKGMRGSFSLRLIGHINKTLAKGGQVMILRSRRSYSPAIQCQDCGQLQKCPHCNVALNISRNMATGSDYMTCHHCGWHSKYTGKCRNCGGNTIHFGAGTQKIEEETAQLFPTARIARLDGDSAQNRTYEIETIRDFSEGKIDILIGTQMISKGFDFSGLSLVAILSADSLLALQDFRADEKAYQLMEQLRGRCGRRDRKGLFVIQTLQPQHPVYQRILNNTTGLLSMDLLEERKMFGFPPYSRIISITIKDKYEKRLKLMEKDLHEKLVKAGIEITYPYSPMPDKIADQHIRCMRVSMAKDRMLNKNKSLLRSIIAEFEKERKYTGHIVTDVDPT